MPAWDELVTMEIPVRNFDVSGKILYAGKLFGAKTTLWIRRVMNLFHVLDVFGRR